MEGFVSAKGRGGKGWGKSSSGGRKGRERGGEGSSTDLGLVLLVEGDVEEPAGVSGVGDGGGAVCAGNGHITELNSKGPTGAAICVSQVRLGSRQL